MKQPFKIFPLKDRRKILSARDYSILYALENNNGFCNAESLKQLADEWRLNEMHKNALLLFVPFELAKEMLTPIHDAKIQYYIKQAYGDLHPFVISFELFKHLLNTDEENEQIKEQVINQVNTYNFDKQLYLF